MIPDAVVFALSSFVCMSLLIVSKAVDMFFFASFIFVDMVFLTLSIAVDVDVLILFQALETAVFMLFHVSPVVFLILFQVSVTFFLILSNASLIDFMRFCAVSFILSQFLYKVTPIATKAPITATTASTIGVSDAITPAIVLPTLMSVPITDTTLPMITSNGPMTATIPAIVTIVFCVSGESAFHFSLNVAITSDTF